MKILHIAEAFGGGLFNYIKNLCVWQSREYQVYVAYGIRPETPGSFQDQFDSSVTFIKVEGFTREIEPKSDWKAFWQIRKIVEDIKPDLIHLHSTKAGILGRWAIDTNKYHVLYSPHAYSFLMMDCSRVKRIIYTLAEKVSDRRNVVTIALTQKEYEASKRVTKNSVCIPGGVNTDELDSIMKNIPVKKSKQDSRNITISMMGRIVPQKAPLQFNEIATRFPGIRFQWIGDGSLRSVLVSKNIDVTGWMSRSEAIKAIAKSDIFLFPTAWEGMPVALMEVMYIGKPCVVSAVDGNRDLIQNGWNGYVCNSPEEYVDALKALIRSPELREQYGKQAHDDIAEKYNVRVMEQNYRALIKQVCASDKM